MTKPSDNTIRAGFDDVAELATRLRTDATTKDTHFRDAVARLMFERGDGLRAAAYGTTTGQARMWCWEHERDLPLCHKDKLPCSGERIDWKDPAGDAAIIRVDKASKDVADLDQQLRIAKTALLKAEAIVRRYPAAHAPTLFDLEQSDGCQSCSRVGASSSDPPHRREVEPGVVWRLCYFCAYGWTRMVPSDLPIPPREIVQAHHDAEAQGKRLKVRTAPDGSVTVTLDGQPRYRIEAADLRKPEPATL